jgi:hypothetical protein
MPQFYSQLSFLLSNYRSCLAGSGRKTSEAGLYVSIPLDRKNSNPHGIFLGGGGQGHLILDLFISLDMCKNIICKFRVKRF